jgi:Asp-tRNA(Asn)/Glu-tRNA(Gln) amidotransferase A subunit family amidase
VAVALHMMAVADGSDYMGSLRNPTAFNNVFGFRTCYGRVPVLARDVFLPSMGVVGPIARTVPDLAMLLACRPATIHACRFPSAKIPRPSRGRCSGIFAVSGSPGAAI